MKNCFDKDELQIDTAEYRTPTDKRTKDYKKLIKRVREMKCNNLEYGYFTFLAMRDIKTFTHFNLN